MLAEVSCHENNPDAPQGNSKSSKKKKATTTGVKTRGVNTTDDELKALLDGAMSGEMTVKKEQQKEEYLSFLRGSGACLKTLVSESPPVLRSTYKMPIRVINSLEEVREAMSPLSGTRRQRMKVMQHCAPGPGVGSGAIGQRQLMDSFTYHVEDETAITAENAFFWRKENNLYEFYERIPTKLAAGEFPDVADLITKLKAEARLIFDEINKHTEKNTDAYKEMISQAVLGLSADIALGVCAGTHFSLNFHNGLHSSCVGTCAKEIIEENGMAEGDTSQNETIKDFLRSIVTAKNLGYEWSFLKYYSNIAYLCGLAHDLALQWVNPPKWVSLPTDTESVPSNLQHAEAVWAEATHATEGFGRIASSCCKNTVSEGVLKPTYGTYMAAHKLKLNCTEQHPASQGTHYDAENNPSAWEIMAKTTCVWSKSSDNGVLIKATADNKSEYVIGSEALSVFYLFRIIEDVTAIAFEKLGTVGGANSAKKLLDEVVMPAHLRKAIVENIRFTVPCFFTYLATVINYGRLVPINTRLENDKTIASPDVDYLREKVNNLASDNWEGFYANMMDVLSRVTAVGDLGESSFEAHFSTIFLSQGIVFEEKPKIIFYLWRAFKKLNADWVAEENKASLKRAAVAYLVSWHFFESQKSFATSRNLQLEQYLIGPVKTVYGQTFEEPGTDNAQKAYKHLLYLFANVSEKKKNMNPLTMPQHLNGLMDDFCSVASYLPESAVPEGIFGDAQTNENVMSAIFTDQNFWTCEGPSFRNWGDDVDSLKPLKVIDLKRFVFAQFTTLALRLCGDVVDKDFDAALNPKAQTPLSQSKSAKKSDMENRARDECNTARERLSAMLESNKNVEFFQKPLIQGTNIPACKGLETSVDSIQ